MQEKRGQFCEATMTDVTLGNGLSRSQPLPWRQRGRTILGLVAALGLLILLIATSVRAEEKPRWPRNTDELRLNLSVKYALEGGPFVCKVELKNVSDAYLQYGVPSSGHAANARPLGKWKERKEPLCRVGVMFGCFEPQTRVFGMDQAEHTFFFHRDFLSVPAGKVPVGFGWDVYRLVKKPKELELLFEIKETQKVEILPATPKNVAVVLHRLEAEFIQVAKDSEGKSDYGWWNHDPAAEFVETITRCQHKEFLPLLLRTLDRLSSAYFRRQIVATIYESFATPEEGFAAVADYLSSPHPVSAGDVFAYWSEEETQHAMSKCRQQELLKKQEVKPLDYKNFNVESFHHANTFSEEEAWKTSKRHLDTRPTKEQFERLFTTKNIWIRILLYSHFPDRCSKAWVKTLLDDLKQGGGMPRRLGELLAKLDDDSFEVRERASAELLSSDPADACYLRAMNTKTLSLEAKARLREVLAHIDNPDGHRLWQRTIRHLGENPSPQNRKMLEILKASNYPSRITKAARQAIEDPTGQKQPPPRPENGME